ncbi:hypothetical protein [Burkholderia sp. Ac-20379]|uniref:hypothetical protein n=1 Tax=Burkholderia sp. Ac-20379 TaxID=2703900 RepID=UPI0019822A92|nr:hypothetical protein [Burkholderia sp. Ac-20379]MBN3726693.1 hypothetical protein [Burkholderia sp. Ac-20379]
MIDGAALWIGWFRIARRAVRARGGNTEILKLCVAIIASQAAADGREIAICV